MAERVLVISKVNAVFVVAVPMKLCVKKIHEKQKNSVNMETIYLQMNYRDFYIALFHSCERLTKVCAYFSTTKKKKKRNTEIFVSSDIRGRRYTTKTWKKPRSFNRRSWLLNLTNTSLGRFDFTR